MEPGHPAYHFVQCQLSYIQAAKTLHCEHLFFFYFFSKELLQLIEAITLIYFKRLIKEYFFCVCKSKRAKIKMHLKKFDFLRDERFHHENLKKKSAFSL